MFILSILLSCAAAYMLGSVNLSIILSRLVFKKDVRDFGSGNAGLTNATRTMGKRFAPAVAAWDTLKPIISVWLSILVFWLLEGGSYQLDYVLTFVVAFCAFVGHIKPLWHGFRGGKGILAAAGLLIVFDWASLLVLLGVFLLLAGLTRIVSVGSLAVALLAPVVTLVANLMRGYSTERTLITLGMTAILGGIIIFNHRKNIVRLVHGEELRFTKKVKM